MMKLSPEEARRAAQRAREAGRERIALLAGVTLLDLKGIHQRAAERGESDPWRNRGGAE